MANATAQKNTADMIAQHMFTYLEQCQKDAEGDNPQFSNDFNIMPYDAIQTAKIANIREFLNIVAELLMRGIEDTDSEELAGFTHEKNLDEMLTACWTTSIYPTKEIILQSFNFVGAAFEALSRKYLIEASVEESESLPDGTGETPEEPTIAASTEDEEATTTTEETDTPQPES